MTDDLLLSIGTVVFLVGVGIELVFLVHYLLTAPAFKSLIGVMFVFRSTSFLLAGAVILLGRMLGPHYPGRPLLTFSLFLIVLASAVITYVAFVYERYFRNGRRAPWHFPFTRALTRRRGAAPQTDAENHRPSLRIVDKESA